MSRGSVLFLIGSNFISILKRTLLFLFSANWNTSSKVGICSPGTFSRGGSGKRDSSGFLVPASNDLIWSNDKSFMLYFSSFSRGKSLLLEMHNFPLMNSSC